MSEEAGFVRSLYEFKIRENDSGQVKSKGCVYVFVRGANKGRKCLEPVEQGLEYCINCKDKPNAKRSTKIQLCFALRWKAVKDLSFFRDNGTFTDITLIVNGLSFHAHKLILAIASPYFASLFLSGFKEASNNSITLKDITCEVFRLFIDLMYGKEVTINN